MRPILVEAPVGVVVPVAILRDEARVDGTDRDQALVRYEAAAVALLDGYSGRLGRCILRQKWALPLVANCETVFLPFPDCRDLKIERLVDGDWEVVSGPVLEEVRRDEVHLTNMPSDWAGVHLTCISGWETAADVPANLINAISWIVAYWHDHPSKVDDHDSLAKLPAPFEAMISPLVAV